VVVSDHSLTAGSDTGLIDAWLACFYSDRICVPACPGPSPLDTTGALDLSACLAYLSLGSFESML